jgi:chromate reductase
MIDPIHTLGFAGSLRRDSYNRAVLRAATKLLPKGMSLEIFDLAPIPLYNADVQAEGYPEPVQEFRDKIEAADALLIVSPEYNYSIPGVLKNALDWASRPAGASPLREKPVGIMGASNGHWGTVRAQLHLRQFCFATDMRPLNHPQVLIPKAGRKFDSNGDLIHLQTQGRIRGLLEALATWTRQLRDIC